MRGGSTLLRYVAAVWSRGGGVWFSLGIAGCRAWMLTVFDKVRIDYPVSGFGCWVGSRYCTSTCLCLGLGLGLGLLVLRFDRGW